jgi:hypothetical protein
MTWAAEENADSQRSMEFTCMGSEQIPFVRVLKEP